MAWLFAPPRGLARGRAAGNFFSAGCSFYPLLRSLGHEGPAITLHIFDGVLEKSQMKLFFYYRKYC